MMLVASIEAPAAAQLGGTVSFQTDDYFRGHSLSEGRPVATLDLAYDDASGLYLAGAVTGVATRHSGVKLLGFSENIGFARKIGTGPVIDVGLTNTHYNAYDSGGTKADYREVYAGFVTDHVAAHVHYSPHYFRSGVSALYADADGVLRPFPLWRLTGHAGVLTQLDGPRAPGEPYTRYDWKLGVGRRLGPFDLQLAWTDGSPGPDYYDGGEPHHRGALVFGMSYAF